MGENVGKFCIIIKISVRIYTYLFLVINVFFGFAESVGDHIFDSVVGFADFGLVILSKPALEINAVPLLWALVRTIAAPLLIRKFDWMNQLTVKGLEKSNNK